MSDSETTDQIAALPVRRDKAGKLRVLMATSRGTGRWIFPKGWLIDGKKPWHAAEIEAQEDDERTLYWISPTKAAKLVEERDLLQLLKNLTDNQEVKTVVKKLRKAA